MPIFHKYNALFIHIPRTGGTNLENLLRLNCKWPKENTNKLFGSYRENGKKFTLQHLTCEEILDHHFLSKEQFEKFLKFTIIRNPYHRCASLYYYWGGKEKWGNFEAFVSHLKSLHLEKSFSLQTHKGQLYHLIPQYKYIYSKDGELLVDLIIRFENYTDEIHSLFSKLGFRTDKSVFNTRRQKIHAQKYAVLYTDTAQQLVWEVYAKDFELFQYSTHLEKLPEYLIIPTIVPGYRIEEYHEEIFLYHHNIRLASLNETAALIWLLCDGKRSIIDICNSLQEAYSQNSSDIRQDIQATLRQFVSYGAIELV